MQYWNSVDKTELRRWAKTLRAELDIARLSQQIGVHLAEFLRERGLGHVLLYSAFCNEIDLSALQEQYPASYYLPRVDGQGLQIHPLLGPLVRHRYGFLEPSPAAPTADPKVLQAVLVPGLAFDRQGHRLGYGQGFYDRFLGGLGLEVLTVGVAPEALVLERLPADPWDVPVQYLASETGVRGSGFDA